MVQSAAESLAKDEDSCDDLHDAAFASRGCCSFNFPCFRSNNWERISSSLDDTETSINRSWWGAEALKKVREWSELVAGPKWKRFNRSGCRARPAKFQYDPLSYSLNFDQGRGQNWECEVRGFSSRYAPIPAHGIQL